MKWIVLILITFAALILGLYVFLFHRPNQQRVPLVTFPETSSVPSNAQVSNQQVLKDQSAVQQAVVAQVQLKELAFGKTVEVFPYALQSVFSGGEGGIALLHYDSNKGWLVVMDSGGVPEASSLISVGVPTSTAEQLISGL